MYTHVSKLHCFIRLEAILPLLLRIAEEAHRVALAMRRPWFGKDWSILISLPNRTNTFSNYVLMYESQSWTCYANYGIYIYAQTSFSEQLSTSKGVIDATPDRRTHQHRSRKYGIVQGVRLDQKSGKVSLARSVTSATAFATTAEVRTPTATPGTPVQ